MVAEPSVSEAEPSPRADAAEMRARHNGRTIARSVMGLLSAQAISWTSSIVGLAMVPRYLGPQDFGLFATALTITAVLATFATFGTTLHVVKGSARDPGMAATLFVQSVLLRSAICSALGLALLPAAWLWIDHESGLTVLMLVVTGGLLYLIADAGITGMQANHEVGRPAVVRSVLFTVSQFATAGVLLLGGGIVSVAVIHAVTAGTVAIASTTLFWRRFGGPVSVTLAGLLGLARAGRPYLVWDVALMIYQSVGQLILASLVGTIAVGLYAFGYRLMSIPLLIPNIVSSATYPSLAAAAHRDDEHFSSILTGALRLGIVGAMPAAAGLLVLAPDLTSHLAGAEYTNATPVVMVLATLVPFAAVDTILASALLALDRQSVWARMGWVAAAFNPSINLLLIPLAERWWTNGAIGAATATLLTELLMTAAALFLMRRYLRREIAHVLFRTLIATVVMSASVAVVNRLAGPWPAMPVGVVTYVLAAYAVGLVRTQDVAMVQSLLRRRQEGHAVAA